jgi:ABC-2 type transport system permease protein
VTRAIGSELFKMRTTRTFYALVGSALGLVVVPTILLAALLDVQDAEELLEGMLGVAGGLVQIFALLLGILAATTEFRHGTITPTLLVVPDRIRLYVAKLTAGTLIGLALGVIATGAMIGIVVFFGAVRDFDVTGDKLAYFVGGALTSALYAALGVGLGMLVRNQVGAIVGALVYLFIVELILTVVLSFWNATEDIMPKYSLGAVSSGLSGVDLEDEGLVLGQVPAGLLLTGYALLFIAGGLVMMRRRDVTA